jgi:hypothetical protein
MDDRMLHEYRRAPDSRFANDLRERLRGQETRRGGLSPALLRGLAVACGVAILVAAFSVPAVRVSAQAFLDLFRVKRFAAVQFQEARMEKLRSLEKESGLLVFDREEKLVDPGPARYVATSQAAGSEAGFQVGVPGYLPAGLAADSVFVEGNGEMRLYVSEAKLRTLLDRLDLHDVTIPPGLDAGSIEVRKPPVVIQRFQSERRKAILVQARSPEVSVPTGWDVERLAEIGLRILGLDPGEARRIARATDWRTTLLVPVPVNASTFRQVTIRGQSGLLITTSEPAASSGKRRREGTLLMWTQGDRVFCLKGNLSGPDIIEMAESIP